MMIMMAHARGLTHGDTSRTTVLLGVLAQVETAPYSATPLRDNRSFASFLLDLLFQSFGRWDVLQL